MTDKPEIVWEEPPFIAPGARSKYDPIAEALRARPGEWARVGVAQKNANMAAAIRGTHAAFKPKGSFEAKSQTVVDGMTIWARFVGEAES